MHLDLRERVLCASMPPRHARDQQYDDAPPPPPPPLQLTPYERASMDMLAGITKMLERQSERSGKSHEEDVAERFRKQGPKEFAEVNLSRTVRPSRTCLGNLDGVFSLITLLATRAWLRPVSRGNRHFMVGGGRLRQSGPRPEARLLRQPALEGLPRSARTDSPRQVWRNKFRRSGSGGGGRF
ncbi:hypothetical protein F511_38186 [Dorcoceras hygrometricum]|uniref:Uncharacterized protein n=1 Tax=Dorcoceras hygrometricum TaxID=472368 RepID=A0A2Z7CRI6_9LAMI|nr:hypothetical protein F511_38186 [Dorcoceras hygrometricum]